MANLAEIVSQTCFVVPVSRSVVVGCVRISVQIFFLHLVAPRTRLLQTRIAIRQTGKESLFGDALKRKKGIMNAEA